MTRKAVEGIDFNLKSIEQVESPITESHHKVNLILPHVTKPLEILVGMTRFELATPSPPGRTLLDNLLKRKVPTNDNLA